MATASNRLRPETRTWTASVAPTPDTPTAVAENVASAVEPGAVVDGSLNVIGSAKSPSGARSTVRPRSGWFVSLPMNASHPDGKMASRRNVVSYSPTFATFRFRRTAPPAGASYGPPDPSRTTAWPRPVDAIITSSIHQPPEFRMTSELVLKRTWRFVAPEMFAVRSNVAPRQLRSRPV